MFPFRSSGSCRVSSILTIVPARSRKIAAFPIGSGITKPSGGGAPVDVIANVREDLIQDRRTRLSLLMGNDERRINSHAREISHRQKATLERFLENSFRDLSG